MLSKLPDLFDRNFAMAYFLPFTLFLASSIGLTSVFGYLPRILQINTANQIDVLIGTSVLWLISWLGGILLLASNRDIIRFIEGYGKLNPLRLLSFIEKFRFRKSKLKTEQLDSLYEVYANKNEQIPMDIILKRGEHMQEEVTRFPDTEQWLLPTSFGNIIRSFEVYPRVMYGLDAIPGWTRLLAVIPKEYLNFVDDAKAQVDFWINIMVLSILFIVEYTVLVRISSQIKFIAIPLIALALAIISYLKINQSAIIWGQFIRASFDLYTIDLAQKLGISDRQANSKLVWSKFSQAVIYVDPDSLPIRAKKQNVGNRHHK